MGSRFRSVCVAAFLALGCEPAHVPVPGSDPDAAPPGVEQEAYSRADQAGQACMVLAFLSCPEATPGGDLECADTIRTLVEIGTFEKKNVLCIRTSRSVEAVRRCDVECVK